MSAPSGVDPTVMAELFITLHEMFRSAVTAGFSEYQACVMLGAFLAASGQGGTGSTE